VPLYTTGPTQPLCSLLWADAIKVAEMRGETPAISEKEIISAEKHFASIPYEEEEELFDGTSFTLHDAGHITGSAQIVLRNAGKTLIYTGDLNSSPTRLHPAASVPENNPDLLVIESTYADRDHPPRKQVEESFIEAVNETLEEGNVLIPCFAVGRTQEMLMVIEAAGIKAKTYVDGMGIKTSELLPDFPSYCRDPQALGRSLAKARFVQDSGERNKIASGSGKIIIATAGMLDGGPALTYLERLNKQGNGAVLLTGYQAADTNGRLLLEKSEVVDRGKRIKVNLPVKVFDFSAHSGRKQLHQYVEKMSPQKVWCIHGDEKNCELFASELREKGFDAHAPKPGEEAEI